MGFIDLFIKPDSNNNEEKASSQKKQAPQATAPQKPQPTPLKATEPAATSTEAPVSVTYTSDSTSEISMDVQKKLWKTLQDRNIPGPDLMEVLASAGPIESLGLPIEKQYELAFNIVKSNSPKFDKRTLLNSIDVYIGYVNEELESGKRQFSEKRRHEVDNKRQEVTNMTNNRTLLMAQIEDLKKRCEELTQKIDAQSVEVERADKELTHNEQIFENTVKALVEKLEKDKQIMSNLNI